MGKRLALAAAAFLAFWLGASASAATFLYVLRCDARVDKLDTEAGRKVETFELAAIGDNRRVIPAAARGFDGCLLNHSRFDPKSLLLFSAVPVQAQVNAQGKRDYRVLAFSVPSMKLDKEMPGGKSLAGPPWIELTGDTPARVALSGQPRQSPLPDRAGSSSQVLETTGERSLVRVFTAAPGNLVVAVADRGTKSSVPLTNLPSTTALDVHLSPDGQAVLVVETVPGGSTRTGRLALFSSATGMMLKQLEAPEMREMEFVSLSPSGKAIFRAGDTYAFVTLGLPFAAGTVRDHRSDPAPEQFYSDR